jgi:hypothetical protein
MGGAVASACLGQRLANLGHPLPDCSLSAPHDGANSDKADPPAGIAGIGASPHDFVGLLGLIGTPGPSSCLAC